MTETLAVTLLCARQTAKIELRALYRSRWHVELDLRNIKTTLGMATLSCLTPTMALKELWVYLLAYNLIRLMMAQAAVLAACTPRELSFKHTVQLWIAWGHYGLRISDHDLSYRLCVLITQQHVGKRPGRIEPRAVKRRPESFPLLTMPRDLARQYVGKRGQLTKLT